MLRTLPSLLWSNLDTCAVRFDEIVEMKIDPRSVARQKCSDYLFDKDSLL